jgi:activator of 2-hydroxyglutaryl-CoA dehydratase
MKQLSGGDIKVPAHPQLMGALGAALYAQERASGME